MLSLVETTAHLSIVNLSVRCDARFRSTESSQHANSEQTPALRKKSKKPNIQYSPRRQQPVRYSFSPFLLTVAIGHLVW